LILEGFFKVLLWRNGFSLLVDELESEVSHNPEEGGEVLGVLFGVGLVARHSAVFNLNVLGQVYNQRQILKSVFIDGAHGVVDEER
jgi:hypothetical protein